MIGTDINIAKYYLTQGKVIGIPTETVYGLAGNAYDIDAIKTIYHVKKRPFGDPLIVHTHSVDTLQDLVVAFPPIAQKLALHFWPGPLTLLLPKKEIIPNLVTANSPFVGIRIPNHPVIKELLQVLPFPLVAPSANPFGYISPTTAQHVADQLTTLPYILDGGACKHGLESTIIGMVNNIPTVYRLGAITLEEITAIVGTVHYSQKHYATNETAEAPGTFAHHYAPRTKLYIGDFNRLLTMHKGKKIGALLFDMQMLPIPKEHQFVLSCTNSLSEVAHRLFLGLRYLDQLKLDMIIAPFFPDVGLGKTINERLLRASLH